MPEWGGIRALCFSPGKWKIQGHILELLAIACLKDADAHAKTYYPE